MAKTFNKQKLAEEALIKNEENIMKVVEERTAELLESKDRYRSLINNIPDVIWRTDSKGNSLFISSNVESVYGYTPDEIYQAGSILWLGRIHPDDVEDVRKSFHQLYEKGIKLNIEYRIKRKDGQWIWLEDRSIGTYEKDGITYADGICSDITKRKQAENSLMRANKLESVGRLAFGIAHEISNPLTNISLGIQILKKLQMTKKYCMSLN